MGFSGNEYAVRNRVNSFVIKGISFCNDNPISDLKRRKVKQKHSFEVNSSVTSDK